MALAGSATVVVVERDLAAQELIDQALRGPGHRVLIPDEQYLSELDGEVCLRRPFSLDELLHSVAQALKRDSPVG